MILLMITKKNLNLRSRSGVESMSCSENTIRNFVKEITKDSTTFRKLPQHNYFGSIKTF